MMILGYVHGETTTKARHVVTIFVLLAGIAYGFSALPSANVMLEFGCELGDPIPSYACNGMMLILSNVFSIFGVRGGVRL